MSEDTPAPATFLYKTVAEDVNKERPWDDDKLERKMIAEVVGKILTTMRQPFVVPFDAPYGTGKTFFISRLQ